jgi:hypothetical protein
MRDIANLKILDTKSSNFEYLREENMKWMQVQSINGEEEFER